MQFPIFEEVYSEQDPIESTIKLAVLHLNERYKCLSVDQFNADSLKSHSRLFCILHLALEAAVGEQKPNGK